MKTLRLASFLLLLAGVAMAGNTATQNVDVTIPAVDEVAVSGDATITFATPSGGSGFSDATDASTTLSWTTNQSGREITIAYDAAHSGITLKCEATSISGGTSAGQITLGTSAADFVTSIDNTSGSATLSYTASATLSATTSAYVVTFTIQAAV